MSAKSVGWGERDLQVASAGQETRAWFVFGAAEARGLQRRERRARAFVVSAILADVEPVRPARRNGVASRKALDKWTRQEA